jgi:hypothetical protein
VSATIGAEHARTLASCLLPTFKPTAGDRCYEDVTRGRASGMIQRALKRFPRSLMEDDMDDIEQAMLLIAGVLLVIASMAL